MNRYICIHGHFYQPPRENPWLEKIEAQDSAYPYHDWNKRITAECYAPCTASRILDLNSKIIDIVNLYSKISFNFGPTLLKWLKKHEAEVYQGILQADKKSQTHFGGHGSALAQVYNHMIMPLANSKDKLTQILWGIKDFEFRFERKPEGMWLAETAVDLESLDMLAEQGIRFTILAPHQAHRVRQISEQDWELVENSNINPQRPYLCKLPSGRAIAVFFYDGSISHELAFGGILSNGEVFAQRLLSAFDENNDHPQLVHIATDGETYGHHHRHGDMALAYCLHYIESQNLARLTSYGQYLELYPPAYEVEVWDNSSWSCAHGVERWKNNCGCNSGTDPGWTQEWRAPLRGALDWLRDQLTTIYEEQMKGVFADPWMIRNVYIDVLLNRSPEKMAQSIFKHSGKELTSAEKVKILKLLEMQRNAMFMYTSCGWFFDELSGIESVQVLQYAARAIQLAEQVSDASLEAEFLNLLQKAPSNLPAFENGKKVYEMLVKITVVDLLRVGIHFAMLSLFKENPGGEGSHDQEATTYVYTIKARKHFFFESGGRKLCLGTIAIRSDITLEESLIDFSVLYMGELDVVGRVRPHAGEEQFSAIQHDIKTAFTENKIQEVIAIMNRTFPEKAYSLWHLFRDEQRDVVSHVFSKTSQEIETLFRQNYERCYSFWLTVEGMGIPAPLDIRIIIEYIFNKDINKILAEEQLDINKLQELVKRSYHKKIVLDKATFRFVAEKRITQAVKQWISAPEDRQLLEKTINIFNALEKLELDVELWKSQNMYFSVGKALLPAMLQRSESDESAKNWLEIFTELGEYLKTKVL
jgi:alpha-amylase/alpha-mannosidase (GH57 family)